jgi:hypothetical protein
VKLHDDKHVLQYCDLIQKQDVNKLKNAHHPQFASPPTLDTDYYNSTEPLFWRDNGGKAWKQQANVSNRMKIENTMSEDLQEAIKYVNSQTDITDFHTMQRLLRLLKTHSTYKDNLCRSLKNFKLIRI